MDKQRFTIITEQFSQKNVLVVGDLMLDTYFWGHAERISPEAPVPIVEVDRIEHNPGGAANVALNLAALGARVNVAGQVGEDMEGSTLRHLLKEKDIGCAGIVTDDLRPTTVKSRIMAHSQQVVRADREMSGDLSEKMTEELLLAVDKVLDSSDAVILEDYNKGVLHAESISSILDQARSKGVPVYVDPKKQHFLDYQGVRLFKPNFSEFRIAFPDSGEFMESGKKLRKKLNAELVMVTRGEKGVSLFTEDGHHHIPTKARKVHDVSGAGDTVISTFVLSDLAGATPEEAAILANYAAGRVCEEVGVVPITLDMLAEIVDHHNSI